MAYPRTIHLPYNGADVFAARETFLFADFLSPNSAVPESLKKSFMDVARIHGVSTEYMPYNGAHVDAKKPAAQV